jgi:ketopantoate hydroxymethyltransferase
MTERRRVTLPQLQAEAARGEPITWPTCDAFRTAVPQDAAGVDMILVGDGLGEVDGSGAGLGAT